MKLAVLLLQNSDSPRATTYTREWVHKLFTHTTGFLTEQSGDREVIEFRVFDWFTLPMTAAEWDAAGWDVGPQVRPLVERGLQVDLSPYTHVALVIDRADARLAAVSETHPQYVHVAAQDMDAALLEHEIGHFFGAGHANLASPTGPIEYGDRFCVMGGEGDKYSYGEDSLNLIDANGNVSTTLSDSGPGMVVPTLLACGWLDADVHGKDITPSLRNSDGRAAIRLPALRGAPQLDQPREVFAYATGVTDETLTVEVRWRDGYDRAMPDPGEGGIGWVVLHSASSLGRSTSTLQLVALPARVGATSYVASAAVGISVTEVDAAGGFVTMELEVERNSSHYASVWEQHDGVAWQARHGISAAEYQQTFTELANQGYRLTDVDVHTGNGQPRFSGIWRLEDGPAWQARHGLTSDQYQQTFDEMASMGYRLLCVSGYDVDGQAYYAGIWAREDGPAWEARHGLTADQYQELFDTLPARGFRPVRVNAYTVAGRDLFATIWYQQDGPTWQAHHGLSSEEYQRLFDDLTQQGWKLLDVAGYGSGGQDRYVCLWAQSSGPAWEARHGLTPFLHQQEFTAQLAKGHRLVRISGHNPWG